MHLLIAGDLITLIGIAFVCLTVIFKLSFMIVKKEFKLFGFLIKCAVVVVAGGGLILFLGRLLA